MKRIMLVCCAWVFLAMFASAGAETDRTLSQIPKDKVIEIERTLRLVGMEKLLITMKTQMFGMMRQQFKQAPEEYWKKAEEKFDTHELIALIVPLYDKYYTTEDLKALNVFYESPVGQKVLGTLPQITQESMKIGQKWGEDVGRRVQHELEETMRSKKTEKNEKAL